MKFWTESARSVPPPPEAVRNELRRLADKSTEVVGEMQRQGVGILAGCDALTPGFCLHDELEWMVKGGLSPMQALQAATRNPAEFLGKLDALGTVEQGKTADLVLLEADPLQDIKHTRRIAAVVVKGMLLDRGALDTMLAIVKAVARKQ